MNMLHLVTFYLKCHIVNLKSNSKEDKKNFFKLELCIICYFNTI